MARKSDIALAIIDTQFILIMSIPTSPAGNGNSLLDRVKMFLPQIERANKDLEAKIREEGESSVQIDANMGESAKKTSDEGNEEVEKEEEHTNSVFLAPSSQTVESAADSGSTAQNREVQLEFALGDFDETPIAKMEAAKEEKANAEDDEED